jgi:hypothetical protein
MSRFKVYDLPHRGIRNALAQLLLLAGKTDFRDAREVAGLHRTGQEVINLLTAHAADEEEITLAALEDRHPGSSLADIASHRKAGRLLTELDGQLRDIFVRSGAGLPVNEKGRIFYWALNEFYAVYLLHMLEEEVDTQELLWQYFSDAELVTQRRHIITRMPLNALMSWLKYIVPAQGQQERAVFLRGLAGMVPHPCFVEAIRVVEGVLPLTEWQVLDEDLAIAP